MSDSEEAGKYRVENQQSVQGQVVGDYATVIIHNVPAQNAPPSLPALPEHVWNVPFARNPFFTGRKELLERLHTHLRTTQAAALSQPQAISGLGGIGKTQLAVEYAYQYGQEYQAVLWARAETTGALNTSYTEIARVLNLPQQNAQEQEVIVQAVRDWLKTSQGWLLLLDNADDLDLVQAFLPTRCPGHLVLTTRAQTTGKVAQRFEVDTLEVEVGALLLLRRTGLVPLDGSLDNALPADRSLASALSEELGGLPLALDQAGAYIEETQCGLADYHQQYQTRRAELLAHRGRLRDDHPEPVATTWSLSFTKVEQQNPAAADLLRLCAFLTPDAIPEEIVTRGTKELGGVLPSLAADSYLLDQAIAALRAYSLITRDPQARMLTIHRLVQTVLRDGLTPETRQQWMQYAIYAVTATCPENLDFVNWPVIERLLPHALTCTTWIEQTSLATLPAVRLLNNIGCYLHVRARYGEAEPLLKRALAICKQKLGATHFDTANSLNSLAELYRVQGKYSEAEPLLKHALAINKRQLGAMHPTTAISLNNLALLYKDQGKYAKAESLYVRMLVINERQLGAMHPTTATGLNNLAELYKAQGKYSKAEPLLERALAIREQQLEATHPAIAQSLNNLALLYLTQEKYGEAEPLLKRALAIWEQQLGADHPETATGLNNLAELYKAQGKYAEAEPLYRRALAISEQKWGKTHPDTAQSLHNLATLYGAQGKYREAEPLFQQALAIREQVLGSGHPDTGQSMWWLAVLSQRQHHSQEAERLYQQALAVFERTLGVEHSMTQSAQKDYTSLLEEMKQEEATE